MNLQVKKDLEAHICKGINDPRFPLMPQRIVGDLRYVSKVPQGLSVQKNYHIS